MRNWVSAGLVAGMMMGQPLWAEDATDEGGLDCAAQAQLVMDAVNARKDGQSKRKTRRALVKQLDKTAGEMLADWIYSLEDAQLTDEVGEAWEMQCEAL
ncbi:MAG: hypothetical protein N4A61_03045 [Pelagimonas sp.]|jgi:hypothetical protein|nr:hypothetical protein [Pelagimonas sp.]